MCRSEDLISCTSIPAAPGESCRRLFRNHDALLKPLGSPSPPGLWLGERGRGGVRGKTARKAVLGFRPEGGTCLPACVSHRIWRGINPYEYITYEFATSFRPQTQHPGGPIHIPRRWLRVKRNYALGELKWHVATYRQRVEALLTPLSTACQRNRGPFRCQALDAAPYHFTSTTGKSLRRVIALRCQKSSDSNIQPNPIHEDAQSPGLSLVKKSRAAHGRSAERRKKGKRAKGKRVTSSSAF